MIAWADRWQAEGCVDVCLAKLAEVDITTLQVSDANITLFALPKSVKTTAAFAGIQSMCEKWLGDLFGDVYVVITRTELLHSFCALSFPAVLIWAGLVELAVHTENDVAVLLAHWHKSEMGQRCSDDEVLQMGHLLRVGNLKPLFRRFMLPELAWFKGHVKQASIFAGIWENEGALVVAAGRPGFIFPAVWYAAARRGVLPPGASDRSIMTVRAPEAELERMLQDSAAGKYCNEYGCTFYWHGYYWSPQLCLQLSRGIFGAFFQCVSRGPIPAAACVKFTSKINGRSLGGFMNGQSYLGQPNLFPGIASPITSKAQLQSYVTNGCLEVRFELSDVN
jgi:hypothetical protein